MRTSLKIKREGKIMTIQELCEVFSREIGSAFELSKDMIVEQLFNGTTTDMTEEEVFAKMITNSILISANLAVQPMLLGLVEMGIIPKDVLAKVKLKPDIRLVKMSKSSDNVNSREEKETKVTKEKQGNAKKDRNE